MFMDITFYSMERFGRSGPNLIKILGAYLGA